MNSLQSLGIGAFPHYEALMLKVNLDDPNAIDRRGDILIMVRRRLKMLYPDTAYLEMNDSIVFLHNVKSPQSRYASDDVRTILKDVAMVPALPAFSYLAAVSSLGTSSNLPDLMREVTEIERFFDGEQYRDRIMRFEDLGIYKLFMQVTDASELMRFVDPRVRELHDHSFEFFETATVLCENSLNYQETARQLYMHPKTIRYRAERIQKTTGLDFHNPDDRLQIALGSRIFRLLEKEN